jgi:hypothetical protein
MTAPPAPTGGSFGGITLQLPTTTSSSSSSDLYGLGEWGTQYVTPGDIPFPIGVGPKGQALGNDVIKAFAQSGPGSIAQIQRALYLGGYYSSKSYVPTYGVIKPEDIAAFGNAVTTAGQSQQPLSSVLLAGAQVGTAAGVAAARQQRVAAKSQVATVTLPNTQDLEAEAIKTFQQTLGRKATPAEAAAFAASYRAMSGGIQRANNQAQFDATTGPAVTGGITKGQQGALDSQISQVGQTPDAHLGHQLVAGQEDPIQSAEPESFTQQLASLGQVAAQAQSEAVPTGADATGKPGLTQLTQESPEDPSVAAENFARDEHPNQAAAKDTANVFDQFLQILSSSFGGAPA